MELGPDAVFWLAKGLVFGTETGFGGAGAGDAGFGTLAVVGVPPLANGFVVLGGAGGAAGLGTAEVLGGAGGTATGLGGVDEAAARGAGGAGGAGALGGTEGF